MVTGKKAAGTRMVLMAMVSGTIQSTNVLIKAITRTVIVQVRDVWNGKTEAGMKANGTRTVLMAKVAGNIQTEC